MSPALALMPALPPAPPRAPEQLVFRAGVFLELLFEPPLRARAACASRRPSPAPRGDAAPDLLSWRPAPAASPTAAARRRKAPAARKSRPAPKARVIRAKALTDDERRALALDERVLARAAVRTGLQIYRPPTRAACAAVARPCPFVSCSAHLYLDESPRGGIKLNFPHLEPHEMKYSCAEDIADEGGVSLEKVGEALNISMERARQLVVAALAKGKGAVRAEDVEIDT